LHERKINIRCSIGRGGKGGERPVDGGEGAWPIFCLSLSSSVVRFDAWDSRRGGRKKVHSSTEGGKINWHF